MPPDVFADTPDSDRELKIAALKHLLQLCKEKLARPRRSPPRAGAVFLMEDWYFSGAAPIFSTATACALNATATACA